jgi:hypothetical protein
MVLKFARSLAALAALAVLAACGQTEPTVCPADLRVRVTPHETTLVVGQRFQPRVEYLGCAGTKVLATPVVYGTNDPAVLSVDTASGRATAVSVGRATLTADAPAYHFPVQIAVMVR